MSAPLDLDAVEAAHAEAQRYHMQYTFDAKGAPKVNLARDEDACGRLLNIVPLLVARVRELQPLVGMAEHYMEERDALLIRVRELEAENAALHDDLDRLAGDSL